MCSLSIPKVTVAENLVAGVQYLSKRDILTDISTVDSQIALSCKEARYLDYPIEWVKIGQVGVCHEFSCHQYYSAIQKALFSCHNPETFQIIFMVRGDGEKISLYMGVRQLDMNGNCGEIFTESLSSFISNLLPGTKAEYCGNANDAFEGIKALHALLSVGLTGLTAVCGVEVKDFMQKKDLILKKSSL